MAGKRSTARAVAALVSVVGVLAAGLDAPPAMTSSGDGKVTVFADGLEAPRGLAFGLDGSLYVAEGGTAGKLQTSENECEQAHGVGPYSGGLTSRISRIDRHGDRTPVVEGLPSSATTPQTGGFVSGVADVKLLGFRLYGIEAGAGCSHGLSGTHNSLFRVNGNGTTTEIADLSAFQAANPPADDTFEQGDWEPDGTWYSMTALGDAFYAVEPNHQEIDRISLQGKIKRVLDLSAQSLLDERWIGPTSITAQGGNLYFGTLSEFPIVPGTARVYRLTPGGHLSLVATGLSTVLGIDFDLFRRLYVLESMTNPGFPLPTQAGSGKVVRIERDGSATTVVENLSFPSAMTFARNGDLYISNFGFGPPTGEIVRVDNSCFFDFRRTEPCSR
jgi:hypothetical protein